MPLCGTLHRQEDTLIKYYAVKIGRAPGIYTDWETCKQQVHGYPGAIYKSFKDRVLAEAYLNDEAGTQLVDQPTVSVPEPTDNRLVAYVDGSYDVGTGRYACGVVMLTVAGKKTFSKAYSHSENAKLHNVAGELAGAYQAMAYALDQGVSELVIVHDYTGIAEWARGTWKANLPLTQDYQQYAQHVQGKLKLRFIKVKGHSGDTYNDYADRLAKKALGIKG